jgi:hypothetical protein
MLIGLNALDNAIDANYTKYLNDKIILGINRTNIRYHPFEETYIHLNNALQSDNFNLSKIEDLNHLKYVLYYFIEFNLIPSLIDRYRDYKFGKIESFNESILTDESYFSQYFKNMTIEKIKIQKKIISYSSFEIIYDFGKIQTEPLCRYAIFYVDIKNAQYEYITLEKYDNYQKYDYCIGSVRDNIYIPFDVECAPEIEVFESFVQHRMKEEALKSLELINHDEKFYAYYDLEFKHLPTLFSIYEKRLDFFKSLPDGDNFLYNISKIKNSFNLSYNSKYINWEEFHFYKKNLALDVVEYIYDFGKVVYNLNCRYAIYYIDHKNNIYRYFTLEKAKKDDNNYLYLICGLNENKRHKGYGIECEDNFETFENLVLDIIETQFKYYKESDL